MNVLFKEITLPPRAAYLASKVGLIIFGVFEILTGMLYLALAALLGATPFYGFPPIRPLMYISSVVVFFGFAVFFLWIGIGSILRRRWARPVVVIASLLWLAFEIPSFVFTIFFWKQASDVAADSGLRVVGDLAAKFLPHALSTVPTGGPAGLCGVANAIGLFFVSSGLAGLFLIAPAVLALLFYTSRHVSDVMDKRSTKTYWTDQLPMAVMGVCMGLFMMGVFSAVNLFDPAVFPFGWQIHGAAAFVIVLLITALYFILAFYTLKRRSWAWIATFVWSLVSALSGVTALLRGHLAARLSRDLFPIIPKGAVTPHLVLFYTGATGIVSIAWLVFLLGVRGHFQERQDQA
jgi:hypothetical protein